MISLPHCGSAGGDALRRLLEVIGSVDCGHSRLQYVSVFEISGMFVCKSVAKLRRNSYIACLISQNFNDLKISEKL